MIGANNDSPLQIRGSRVEDLIDREISLGNDPLRGYFDRVDPGG
jgi:hypothetical protein